MTLFPAILLALLLDALLGDPPNRLHPTAWMGSLIQTLLRFRPRGNQASKCHCEPGVLQPGEAISQSSVRLLRRPGQSARTGWETLLAMTCHKIFASQKNFAKKMQAAEFLYGCFILLVGLVLTLGIGWVLTLWAASLPFWAALLVHALTLKLTVSLRGLDRAAAQVQSALQADNLPEARRLLAWHLVSRDTSQLDAPKLTAAAIESVAENASDGVIAPLFFYAIGGLPLALAYRFANTADSLLGYHDAEREWLGKAPARLDDLLNLVPARLTGLFILLAALISRADAPQAWRILRRDARLTASPNAGVPMSAMAGALGVELEKAGHYVLGAGLRPPSAADLTRARHLLALTALLAASSFTVWSSLVH